MTGQELKIIFRHDKAYLTSDRSLSLEQLELKDTVETFKKPAFWTIRVLSYEENEKRIFCEIISYQVGQTDFDSSQKHLADKLNDLQTVTFKSIDTTGLLKTSAGNSAIKSPNNFFSANSTPIQPTEFIRQSYKVSINETFYVPIKDIHFKHGGVAFYRKFREYKEFIQLSISNCEIREEFDAVKNYFANVLKTKKIEVTVKVEIANNEVTSVEAKSPEIERIDKQLIEDVKFNFVKSTTKNKINGEIDKALFTMDEYFETFSDEKFKSNIFYNNDKEFFEDLLAISDTKHYKHLRFLSSRHLHDIMKLRFVYKPFSFVFLIQGNRNYHFVWETLDTEEATYVWHISKDINVLKMSLRKIEDIILLIKVQGKSAYLNSTKGEFHRIFHDYSDLEDGFIKWKGELENILT